MGGTLEVTLEWLEFGWPLGEDGTCDTSAVSEQSLFAMSKGLEVLDVAQRREIFSCHRWSGLGRVSRHATDSWPREFPGSLVLRFEPQLERGVGRGLVLALSELRLERGRRPFTRCVWFVLPGEWSEDPPPEGIAAACERLLAHRGVPGRPSDTPALEFNFGNVTERRGPTLLRVGGSLQSRSPATPSELMRALVEFAASESRGALREHLSKGLAVLCAPSLTREFAYALTPDSVIIRDDWRHPVPHSRRPKPRNTELVERSEPAPAPAPAPRTRPRLPPPMTERLTTSPLVKVMAFGQAVQIGMLAVLLVQSVTTLGAIPIPPERAVDDDRSLGAVDDDRSLLESLGADDDRSLGAVGDDRSLLESLGAVDQSFWESLGAVDETLVVVGLARGVDCDASAERAEALARGGVAASKAAGRETSLVVVGNRTDPELPITAHSEVIAGMFIMSEKDAEKWKNLSQIECVDVSP